MKKDVKNIQASIRARLQNKAKEIERFLCEPINAINKLEKFHTEWKTSGPWECKR